LGFSLLGQISNFLFIERKMNNLMNNQNKFYEKTKNYGPCFLTKEFLRLGTIPGKAIDLGCGAGRDTVALIKNNWNVLSIDKENVANIIKERLTREEQANFKFEIQNFENLNIEKVDLIIANNSISFCNKNFFSNLWNTINNNIKNNGYFVGNFFGIKDEWAKTNTEMIFFTKEEVLNLFNEYKIINFKEMEKEEKTSLGNLKHWHIFEIIAKKY